MCHSILAHVNFKGIYQQPGALQSLTGFEPVDYEHGKIICTIFSSLVGSCLYSAKAGSSNNIAMVFQQPCDTKFNN
jgi:hypothetical protein